MIRVGLPDSDSKGIFSATVELGDDPTVFVAVSACSLDGWLSELSKNERRILQQPEPLGRPEAPAVISY